jgi:biopolymer transport protein ExbB
MYSKKALFVCLIAVVFFVSSGMLSAEEKKSDSVNFGQVFRDGGAVGWVIIGLSVVGLALIIGNAVEMRKEKLVPPDLIEEIEALFEAGEYQEAIELCEAEPTYFTNIVAAGLPKMSASFSAMEKAIEESGEEEAVKLHTKLSWLSLIANVSPMLGLLGTVMGMIQAFNVIASTKGQADPAQLSGGISAALITTMLGLIVAIPLTSAFVFLRNRVVKNSLEISAVVSDLFERFRPAK